MDSQSSMDNILPADLALPSDIKMTKRSQSFARTQNEFVPRSRQNALRHGLTAETVIDALEDAEDYAAFENGRNRGL
jgi:hypothetical protein